MHSLMKTTREPAYKTAYKICHIEIDLCLHNT